MTNSEIDKKINKDFSEDELKRLGARPVDSVQNIAKVDRIIVDEQIQVYLIDFFKSNYTGEPVPQVFSRALIEWELETGIARLYVTFPEDKPEYVYIDIFFGWDFLGKVIYANMKVDNIQDGKNEITYHLGRFFSAKLNNPKYNADAIIGFSKCAATSFLVAYIYVDANKDVEEIYTVDTIYSVSNNSANENSYQKSKKNPMKRERVFVPKKRRIYKVIKTDVTEKNLREYVYSRWKVRGYSYTRKDGRVVNVKEHYKNRHLPNKGIEKQGRDYILKEKDKC